MFICLCVVAQLINTAFIKMDGIAPNLLLGAFIMMICMKIDKWMG
jgi:hypothetical protein